MSAAQETPAPIEDLVRKALRDELAEHVEPRLVQVDTAARALGIAQTACWSLISSGEIVSFKIGRRRLIPTTALDDYVTNRLSETRQSAS